MILIHKNIDQLSCGISQIDKIALFYFCVSKWEIASGKTANSSQRTREEPRSLSPPGVSFNVMLCETFL